jgi:hypothetical protein
MKYIIIPLLSFTILACNGTNSDNSSNQKANSNASEDNLPIKQASEPTDTLNNPYHRSYLADKSTKEIGQMILDNKVQPIDNDATFRVMDSLLSESPEDRKFYFNVFVKILEKADGALSEAVGQPALQYVENYTTEFMDLSAKLSKEQFGSWASFVGWEILLSSQGDPLKDGEEFINKLNSNCEALDNKDKSRLEIFNLTILTSIKENNE